MGLALGRGGRWAHGDRRRDDQGGSPGVCDRIVHAASLVAQWCAVNDQSPRSALDHYDRTVKRPPDGLGPIIALDRRLAAPLHRQLYEGYREAILDGRLRPGQRLPSTRSLARELQISRMPVVLAFEQLVTEGYVESRVGAGSFVSPELRAPAPPAGRTPRPHPGRRRIPREALPVTAEPWLDLRGPFRAVHPAIDEFPVELWARLLARRTRLMSRQQMMYGDAMGFAPLREALAGYLRTVRSVQCTAQQIMIVSGSQQALAIAARALLAPGDAAWIEDPGFPGARDALTLAGARPVPVPVDEDGLDVAAGIRRAPSVAAAYVTPSHEYPLGVIMSAPRRLQLLDWARRSGAWLLEDDYDSEYRYDNQPIASLQGLDTDHRVIYIGTFSKVLFPALRVGYLVIPPDLVARFRRIRAVMDNSPAPLYQAVLHDFLREGHFARHLRRMRGIYAERRRALVAAIERELGDSVRLVGDRAGMHVVVLLPRGARDRDIAVRAAGHGISVLPLSSCYAGRRQRPGLVLGYGTTRVPEITTAVRRLAAILRE
ncbi:MAG: PLP-dependent aminotransferase family protein [Deltaproteobacteria bacterium]|nr:MAG: PLP-dependent aminotransferase family protein [Deltaproteobacteria bacterium]